MTSYKAAPYDTNLLFPPSNPNINSIPLPNGVADLDITLGDESNKWDKWYNWQVSIDELETITGYDFFSNLPDEIESVVEGRSRSQLGVKLAKLSPGAI